MSKLFKPLSYGLAVFAVFVSVYSVSTIFSGPQFRAGIPPEFLERADGYEGLREHYNLEEMPVVEMNASLMYEALKNSRVDVIVGYSTDGRIEALDLKVLRDDRQYFPPYECAPVVLEAFGERYPEAIEAVNQLAGKISTRQMTALNSAVDHEGRDEAAVARAFLSENGFRTEVERRGEPEVLIGGKLQTEQFILAHMYRMLIENYTKLDAGLRTGLAGTQIVFNALLNNEIQVYPEYTGTGLHVLLEAGKAAADSLENDPEAVYNYVDSRSVEAYGVRWLKPHGFENTYALLMRKEHANRLGIDSISDLAAYLDKK